MRVALHGRTWRSIITYIVIISGTKDLRSIPSSVALKSLWDTRVKRMWRNLITNRQAEEARGVSRPGLFVLSRQEPQVLTAQLGRPLGTRSYGAAHK